MTRSRTYLSALYLFTALLFSMNGIRAQQNINAAKDTAFIRTYGGNSFDEARDVKEAFDKGYILVGTSSSFGQGSTSLYVVKTDSMGIHQWSKNYGGLNNDWGYAVENAYGKGYLFVGYSNSFINGNGYDGYLVRTDSAGNLLWEKTIGGTDWDYFYNAYALPDSGYVICGKTYTGSAGNADAWLLRINKNGDTLWTKKYGAQEDEVFNDVVVLKNSIYVAGMEYNSGTGKNNAIVKKYDLNGNIKETYSYHPDAGINYELRGINSTSNYELILVGKRDSLPANTKSSNIVIRIDTLFTTIAGNDLAGFNSTKYMNKSIENSHQEIISVGTVSGGLGGLALFPIQYTANINWIASPTFGGAGDEEGNSILLTSKKYLVFVGSTSSINLSSGNKDMYLVLLKKDSVYSDQYTKVLIFKDTLPLVVIGLDKISDAPIKINLAPNPFREHCKVLIEGDVPGATYGMEVADLSGRIVGQARVQQEFIFSGDDLPPGVYFMRIKGNKLAANIRLLIQ